MQDQTYLWLKCCLPRIERYSPPDWKHCSNARAKQNTSRAKNGGCAKVDKKEAGAVRNQRRNGCAVVAVWPSTSKFLRVMCVFRIVYGVETLALQVRLLYGVAKRAIDFRNLRHVLITKLSAHVKHPWSASTRHLHDARMRDLQDVLYL